MSGLWRVAGRNAVWIIVLSVPAGIVLFLVYGEAHAESYGYGVGVGVLSFISMALTVTLLTDRSRFWRVVGAVSFIMRYGFVAGALGVPAYLGLWPVVAMLGGFAWVYVAENVVLLPRMMRVIGETRV
ncbi:MAG: hypothetical protein AVDCRST_MAG28-1698 [uncultured Rubrobacteraceae bacterium]|uniref:Uncharacterized protein n=1 Tax=uncultured Rubrobacteraceae bacterium TaxID=349277 RepID=A0A6J4Q4H8_9ACTN|nr:MAG: hypothetical protein AVDCRST_MAG28-1698 [uncultured Rubrobacteraceae bacterium]